MCHPGAAFLGFPLGPIPRYPDVTVRTQKHGWVQLDVDLGFAINWLCHLRQAM